TLYRGNYSAFELQRAEKLAQQQAGYEKQQHSIAHMQSFIDRFKAKATKARQAQSRIKALEKMQLIAPAHIDSPFRFEFRPAQSLPSSLININKVSTGYGDKKILSDIEFSLIPGERIGLLGLNGAGKSTFIKLIADILQPTSGTLVRAKELKVGYFAQHQVELLDLDANALLTLQRFDETLSEREIRTYLGGYNFSADKVLQPVGSFSGGEKARLVLALIIWQRPNLLLLDEPTNHLDLEMRLALNQALQGFDGSVILVSHDRHLLRSVCDDLWLVDSGKINRFDDDIDAYPAWLASRKASVETGDSSSDRVDPKQARKQQKSLNNQLKKLETGIAGLETERAALEMELSDNAIYQAESRESLERALKNQQANAEQLELAEEKWLEVSEQLETLGQV
ncbi:MAG: ATP-binding cassette subfamily F protein 3, partial [Gammaproteobacteria bacterium]